MEQSGIILNDTKVKNANAGRIATVHSNPVSVGTKNFLTPTSLNQRVTAVWAK